MTPRLETEQIFPYWEIVRCLANIVPWPYPPDGVRTYFRDVALPAMARGEEWHWTLRLRTSPPQIIGKISLMTKQDNNRAFWLSLPWQGKGLMSEAADIATGYWFNALGFAVLRVPKAAPNLASRRVSAKSGMRIVAREDRDYAARRFPTEIWEITAAEWRAHRSKIH